MRNGRHGDVRGTAAEPERDPGPARADVVEDAGDGAAGLSFLEPTIEDAHNALVDRVEAGFSKAAQALSETRQDVSDLLGRLERIETMLAMIEPPNGALCRWQEYAETTSDKFAMRAEIRDFIRELRSRN